MKRPIYVSADSVAGAILVCYRNLSDRQAVVRNESIAPCAIAGVTRNGKVVDIEIWGVNASTLAAVTEYARARGLEFPPDLDRLLDPSALYAPR